MLVPPPRPELGEPYPHADDGYVQYFDGRTCSQRHTTWTPPAPGGDWRYDAPPAGVDATVRQICGCKLHTIYQHEEA